MWFRISRFLGEESGYFQMLPEDIMGSKSKGVRPLCTPFSEFSVYSTCKGEDHGAYKVKD